jgi:hypothetical protein
MRRAAGTKPAACQTPASSRVELGTQPDAESAVELYLLDGSSAEIEQETNKKLRRGFRDSLPAMDLQTVQPSGTNCGDVVGAMGETKAKGGER